MNTPMAPDQVSAEQPWPGLMPFTEGAHAFFHGRDGETAELFRLIRRETVTVLFGQSGLGKSSLLNAGLFPKARAEDFFPVYIRLDVSAEAESLSAQVFAALHESCRAHRVEAPEPRAGDTLWEFFHRKDSDFWSSKNRLLAPILVFDQFEEIFTLGRHVDTLEERCRAFMTDLADLAEDRLPASLSHRLEEDAAYGEQLDYGKRTYKLVLSFREDYLPDFEGLRVLMPSIMHNRMRLTRMNGLQARKAVLKPGARLVTEPIADQIIRFVASPRLSSMRGDEDEFERLEIEPALLSVVCRELNNKRIRAGAPRITADLLMAGAQQQIIQEFYESSFAGVDARVREFVEDQLLTEAGYRDSYALDDALRLPGLSRDAIDSLIAKRLLRLEERSGARRVELTHDVLTRVARESRDLRLSREAARASREREELRRRRVRRVAIAGAVASATAIGVAVVFAVLLQRANQNERILAASHSNSLLEQATSQLERNVAGEPQANLAGSLRVNPANMGAIGRAVSYLSQRTFPQLAAQLQLTLDGEERYAAVRWHDVETIALRGARGVTLVAVRAGAPARHVFVRGSGDSYENFGLAMLAQLEGATILQGSTTKLAWPDKALPSTVKPVLAYDERSRSLVWSGHGSMLNLTDIETGARVGRAMALGRNPQWMSVAADRSVVAWIEDEKRVRVARLDGGREHVVDVAGGIGERRKSGQPLQPIVLSRDGRKLLVRSRSAEATVYSLWGASPAARRLENSDGSAGFSPDGQYLVASNGNLVSVYDLQSEWVIRLRHPLPINSLEVSPDGKLLVTACQDKFARVWDMRSGSLVGVPMRHEGSVLSATFSRDARRVITGSLDGTARLWSAASSELLAEPLVTGAAVAEAHFSPDGNKALTYAVDGRVAVWRIGDLQPASASLRLPARISVMEASTTRSLFAIASGNEVSLWQVADPAGGVRATPIWSEHLPEPVTQLRFSPDARYLAIATSSTSVHLRQVESGIPLGQPLRHRGEIQVLRFSDDGMFLATGSTDGAARVWRVATQRLRGALMLHTGEVVKRLAFSRDGTLLLSGTIARGPGFLRVWNLEENLMVAKIPLGEHLALAEFSADREIVAVYDTTAVKWQVEARYKGRSWFHDAAGEDEPPTYAVVEQAKLEFGGPMWSAALSPDGSRLVAGLDGAAKLIDVRGFRPFGEPMKSVGVVEAANFSADGRWVVTLSADRMAKVWDSSSGYAVADIARHDSELAGAALVGGGAYFVSAGHDRTIMVSRVGLDFPAPAPDWLPDLLEAAGGGRFDQVGTMSWIANPDAQLRALGGRIRSDDSASWWSRWAAGSISRLAGASEEKQGERKQ